MDADQFQRHAPNANVQAMLRVFLRELLVYQMEKANQQMDASSIRNTQVLDKYSLTNSV